MQGIKSIFTSDIKKIEEFFGFSIQDKLIKGEVPLNASYAWNKYLGCNHYSIVFTYGMSDIKQNNKRVSWTKNF